MAFLLKRKGDYRLHFTRSLTLPGRYTIDLFIFTPYESSLSDRLFPEPQFFQSCIEHRFSLRDQPKKDRIDIANKSYALLSPHYEVAMGSSVFQYRDTVERLRQQIGRSGLTDEPVKRAIRVSETYASQLRSSSAGQSRQQRYFELIDTFFSWHAEQLFLECLASEDFAGLDPELQQSVHEFLQREYNYRKEHEYMVSLDGEPSRVWNRIALYQRLLEYPLRLRPKVTRLGAVTRKVVKAVSTMWIMMLFTYILFNARDASQKLSLTLLLGIGLIYTLRDLVREDMINGITSWLRRGKARWKIRLITPYTNKLLARQRLWLDYRKLSDLPQKIRQRSGRWANNDEGQIIHYRSVVKLDKNVLKEDQIQEGLTLDCEALSHLVEPATNRLFSWTDRDDPASIESHLIEKQRDYNLLLVVSDPDKDHSTAQRWHLQLTRNGIIRCKSKKANWPTPEQDQHKPRLESFRDRLYRWLRVTGY